MAKKYISKINKGGNDLYVKDAETREVIGYDDSVFVDLGLPSGTLWAKCNVGAATETDYGNYYMYGKGSRQYNSSDSKYTGTENPLAAEADTATQVMGALWCMPTKTQFDELIANTTYTWETNFKGSGINGGKLTAANGNYLFFPATGFKNSSGSQNVGRIGIYWSNTPITNSSYATSFYVMSNASATSTEYRITGCSVRGVCEQTPLKNIYTKTEIDAIIADESLIIVGDVTSQSASASYSKHSLLGFGEAYISKAGVTGLPTHIVSQDSEVITYGGEVVTCGENTSPDWIKVI